MQLSIWSKRQRAAIEGFAKANGYTIVAEFYDPGVSGGDVVTERPGFAVISIASPAMVCA